MPDSFGLPGIFDNVRDGLVLVRFPEGQIVLFNRAAGEMCGIDAKAALGTDYARLLGDAELAAKARRCASKGVGEWPGHGQEASLTHLNGSKGETVVEVSICRVEDAGSGGPLVLFVLRPSPETELESTLGKLGIWRPPAPAQHAPQHAPLHAPPAA